MTTATLKIKTSQISNRAKIQEILYIKINIFKSFNLYPERQRLNKDQARFIKDIRAKVKELNPRNLKRIGNTLEIF